MPLMVYVPLLTMRLLAEEQRQGTIEPLLTAPVSEVSVVLGKYLATLAVYVAMWAPTALYMLLISGYGELDWRVVGTGYLATFLVGAAYLSVGTLASSLTTSTHGHTRAIAPAVPAARKSVHQMPRSPGRGRASACAAEAAREVRASTAARAVRRRAIKAASAASRGVAINDAPAAVSATDSRRTDATPQSPRRRRRRAEAPNRALKQMILRFYQFPVFFFLIFRLPRI